MTREVYLMRLLEELAQHEAVICLPCAMGERGIRDAVSYMLRSTHRTPVCRDCLTREMAYGNAPDGLIPVEQPYVTRRIREELRLLPVTVPVP